MTIMRSGDILSVSKLKKLSVRRKKVNWNDVRIELGDFGVTAKFYDYLCSYKYRKRPSLNRLSYWSILNVLGRKMVDVLRYQYGL